uniref:Uncharacterized protein n=1 Tax=Anguilla anguilla TaxID=7936 RepID=A0A0E9Q851_ANGAN
MFCCQSALSYCQVYMYTHIPKKAWLTGRVA